MIANALFLLLGLWLGLWIGSLRTRKALLKMVTYDKIMREWRDTFFIQDALEPFTVIKVVQYVRRNIG